MRHLSSIDLLFLYELVTGLPAVVDSTCLHASLRAHREGSDPVEKAARLLFWMARLRPFPDCNAIITVLAVERFCGRNGLLPAADGTVDRCVIDVDACRMTLSAVRDALGATLQRVYA